MNLTVIAAGDDVCQNCEYINGHTFDVVETRGKSIHIAFDFATLRSKSTRKTANLAQLQDKSVDSTVLNASYYIHAS